MDLRLSGTKDRVYPELRANCRRTLRGGFPWSSAVGGLCIAMHCPDNIVTAVSACQGTILR